jgi:hypothetical protein
MLESDGLFCAYGHMTWWSSGCVAFCYSTAAACARGPPPPPYSYHISAGVQWRGGEDAAAGYQLWGPQARPVCERTGGAHQAAPEAGQYGQQVQRSM